MLHAGGNGDAILMLRTEEGGAAETGCAIYWLRLAPMVAVTQRLCHTGLAAEAMQQSSLSMDAIVPSAPPPRKRWRTSCLDKNDLQRCRKSLSLTGLCI